MSRKDISISVVDLENAYESLQSLPIRVRDVVSSLISRELRRRENSGAKGGRPRKTLGNDSVIEEKINSIMSSNLLEGKEPQVPIRDISMEPQVITTEPHVPDNKPNNSEAEPQVNKCRHCGGLGCQVCEPGKKHQEDYWEG